MLRTTTTQLTAMLRRLAAAVLTATRQAPAQQLLAASDSARPADAAEDAAARTSASALTGRTEAGALNLNLWNGNVRGDVTGHGTVILERVGLPEDALAPVWPVLTRWTVESPQDGRSFVAELFGRIEGSNECMHLRGMITEGWKKGAEVHVDCLSRRKGGNIVLRILPLRPSP